MYAPKTVLVSEEQAAKDRQTLQDPRVAAMAAQLKPFMRDKLNDPINLRFFLSGLEDWKNAAGNRPSEQQGRTRTQCPQVQEARRQALEQLQNAVLVPASGVDDVDDSSEEQILKTFEVIYKNQKILSNAEARCNTCNRV